MKKVFLTIVIISALSCNKVKEGAENAVNNAIENAIEKESGVQVDLPNIDNVAQNSASLMFQIGDKKILDGTEWMQGSVVFQKDEKGLTIALTFMGDGGNSASIQLSKVPEDFELPLEMSIAYNPQENTTDPTATVILMTVNDQTQSLPEMPFEGFFKLTKFNKDEMTFSFVGKGSNMTDVDSPSNWKEMKAEGKIFSPIIMSSGIDKNKVLK